MFGNIKLFLNDGNGKPKNILNFNFNKVSYIKDWRERNK